jgi:hypothetical protein
VRSDLLLRIVAVIAFVQFIGHGSLFILARPKHGAREEKVVAAMKGERFKFALAPRSYWDMYFGYGLEAATVCLVEALLFWQLAGIAGRDPGVIRPIALLFAGANVAHIVMLVRYFALPLPMVFDGLIAAGLIAVALAAE